MLGQRQTYPAEPAGEQIDASVGEGRSLMIDKVCDRTLAIERRDPALAVTIHHDRVWAITGRFVSDRARCGGTRRGVICDMIYVDLKTAKRSKLLLNNPYRTHDRGILRLQVFSTGHRLSIAGQHSDGAAVGFQLGHFARQMDEAE
ncbi:MAG: hypothetical protein AAGC55_15780 [Myxococcota bacterium]